MGWFGIGGTAKNYSVTPYTGTRPPSIDSFGQEILRPTQKQDFDITMRRSLGQDVGYDPSWLTSAAALTRNELGSAKDDRIRNQAGMLSAQGLSGNPRAYEATKGRTERDYSSDLENSMNRLNVANMEASCSDKNAATDRLAALNRFNFGQENTGANFDLSKWGTENQLGLSAAGLAASNYWKQQDQNEQALQDIGTGVGAVGGMMSSPSVTAMSNPAGQGIAPSSSSGAYSSATNLKASPNYKTRLLF